MKNKIKKGDLVKLQKHRTKYSAVDREANKCVTIYPDQIGLMLDADNDKCCIALFDGQVLDTAHEIFEVLSS